jgi:predicted deacylase
VTEVPPGLSTATNCSNHQEKPMHDPHSPVNDVSIADFDVASLVPGAKRRLHLHVMDGLAGPVRSPVLAAMGVRPGRTLFVAAGVHGDEYEGMAAIRRVFGELDSARMNGAMIAIPVANPFAYEARARIAPLHIDGLNLARVFPGDPDGSPSRALAHHLLQLVARCVTKDDLFLDFHSGSADVAFAPLVGFRDVANPGQAASEEAARHFGLPRLWRIPDSPGPFNAEASRLGIPTIGTETTGRAGCDPNDVAQYAAGLRNLLSYLHITPSATLVERNNRPAAATRNVSSPATGFLNGEVRLHDRVKRGDLLGTVVSVFGEPIAEVHAPISGEIWAQRTMPPVRTGELAFMIAEEHGRA